LRFFLIYLDILEFYKHAQRELVEENPREIRIPQGGIGKKNWFICLDDLAIGSW
jgi:hypothetical protein